MDSLTIACYLVFGFNQSTFRDVEQGESYTIKIGYWSGTINDIVIGRVELTLQGTTSEFILFDWSLSIKDYHTPLISIADLKGK